jgi:hypothetical protein
LAVEASAFPPTVLVVDLLFEGVIEDFVVK